MRGAHGEAVDRRQVGGSEVDRPAVGRGADREALGLRLVERHERAAAGIADEDYAPVALLPQEGDAGAQILDAALHEERGVVAGIARVEREQRAAAPLERPDEVMAMEVAARVDDDEGNVLAAAFVGEAPVDARVQEVEAALAVAGAAGLDVDGDQLAERCAAPQAGTIVLSAGIAGTAAGRGSVDWPYLRSFISFHWRACAAPRPPCVPKRRLLGAHRDLQAMAVGIHEIDGLAKVVVLRPEHLHAVRLEPRLGGEQLLDARGFEGDVLHPPGRDLGTVLRRGGDVEERQIAVVAEPKKMWIESADSPTTLRGGRPGSFSGQEGAVRVSGGSRPATYSRPTTLV